MEEIYEKMARWSDEKADYDAHFWQEVYPNIAWENKLIWWRKDIFNAMNRYGVENIPSDWIAERTAKDADFQKIMKEVVTLLGG